MNISEIKLINICDRQLSKGRWQSQAKCNKSKIFIRRNVSMFIKYIHNYYPTTTSQHTIIKTVLKGNNNQNISRNLLSQLHELVCRDKRIP